MKAVDQSQTSYKKIGGDNPSTYVHCDYKKKVQLFSENKLPAAQATMEWERTAGRAPLRPSYDILSIVKGELIEYYRICKIVRKPIHMNDKLLRSTEGKNENLINTDL